MTKARDELLAVINKTAEKTDAARARRKSKIGGDAYILVWNDAMLDTYGKGSGVMPTIKSMGMLSRAMKRVSASDEDRKDFIRYVVVNWKDLCVRLGFKNESIIAQPELPTFVLYLEKFYNQYCRKGSVPVVSRNTEKQSNSNAKRVADLERKLSEALADNKRLLLENAKLKSRLKILAKE